MSMLRNEYEPFFSDALSMLVDGNSPESTARQVPRMLYPTPSINHLEIVQDTLTKPLI